MIRCDRDPNRNQKSNVIIDILTQCLLAGSLTVISSSIIQRSDRDWKEQNHYICSCP